ncbi:MAG: arginine--tRNA ligase [Phycisphaerae bacterium]|nr:arginine--tRNA ligase [Phycisphaerae bacterium]
MKKLTDILEERVSQAIKEVCGQAYPAMVRAAADGRFGDYQANGVMAAAKAVKSNPRQLAERVVAAMEIADLCEPPEVAGPGFINLRLKDSFLAERLLGMHRDAARLGIDKAETPKTVVVDYSGPNIAKEMHVGHLRSTIIGDCIARLYEYAGHTVIRQNHIGDWGTQFGKVILALWHICMAENLHKTEKPYYDLNLPDDQNATVFFNQIVNRHQNDWCADSKFVEGDGELYFRPFLDEFSLRSKTLWPVLLKAYQYVNLLDEAFKGMKRTIKTREKIENGQFVYKEISYESLSRYITYMLQQGGQDNEQERKAWSCVKEITMQHCAEIYKLLNATLEHPRDTRGESDYNDKLPQIVIDLKARGLATESDGAICVFPEGFKNKEGDPLPFIIQKSDGAFLYATTDLAALRYRLHGIEYQGQNYQADRVIYVTDARQALHFQMLFATAKLAGWVKDGVVLEHVTFGTMLGEDGRPFKTRTGGTVKLKDLLDEAIERATAVVEKKNPDLPAEQKVNIAKAVGVGAVKYADYANNRNSDYVFSFDKMLAMEGNTAPYMQYAYARIKSIERKATGKDVDIEKELAGIASMTLAEPAEKDLAKLLVRYDQAIAAAMAECRPNYLTGYLYDVAQAFSRFYTTCPVLTADPESRPARLLLCDLTARTIRHGMSELLGIEVVEQM